MVLRLRHSLLLERGYDGIQLDRYFFSLIFHTLGADNLKPAIVQALKKTILGFSATPATK